jgi:outer membrane protein
MHEIKPLAQGYWFKSGNDLYFALIPIIYEEKSMKYLRYILFTFSALTISALLCAAAPATFEQSKPLRIAVVNFKKCVEKSKVGQKEQSNFDSSKKQMEKILEEKEKALADVATKFNDIDYLDSLSAEAEAELKRQYRTLTQEFSQQQQQFYQQLSQTNVVIIQKLQDKVVKASQEVSKKYQIDLVLNDEVAFFSAPTLDVSDLVIQLLDETEKESDASKTQPASAK